MHRVELKAYMEANSPLEEWSVPNAPCGVESHKRGLALVVEGKNVPNAPCGVESPKVALEPLRTRPFLMHRVELKVLK